MNIQRIGTGRTQLALIHGWGLGARVWEPVIAPLAHAIAGGATLHLVSLPGYDGSTDAATDFADTAEALAANLPDGCIGCGWSMGGMLALQAAHRHPEKFRRLILVGSTPRFVQDADWRCAQAVTVLEGFRQALEQDAASTLRRFIMLFNQGDANARAINRALTPLLAPNVPDTAALQRGLGWLGSVDLRGVLPEIAQDCLLLHGTQDALIPLAAAEAMTAALPSARLQSVDTAAHAPFHAAPAAFISAVASFCNEPA